MDEDIDVLSAFQVYNNERLNTQEGARPTMGLT
jgi:hypothetical protein